MQKAMMGSVRQKMDKTVGRRELPSVRRSRLLYRQRVTQGTMLRAVGRKK